MRKLQSFILCTILGALCVGVGAHDLHSSVEVRSASYQSALVQRFDDKKDPAALAAAAARKKKLDEREKVMAAIILRLLSGDRRGIVALSK